MELSTEITSREGDGIEERSDVSFCRFSFQTGLADKFNRGRVSPFQFESEGLSILRPVFHGFLHRELN